ncbi:MAG: tetratricopeptide repeat protein [Clostridia bacterium]|nr:tetratricopeptide repeat protein [Clostridia bacterium]
MLVEKIVFAVLATYLLIMMFFKFISKIDKIYISILVMQSLGLLLEIIEMLFTLNYNIFIKIIMYLISVVMPIIILLLEYKGKNFSEIIFSIIAKFYDITGNSKKNKELWLKLIDKYPDNYLAHVKLAEIYEKEGGMRKAIDEYVKAVDINKKDYDSYYKISFLLNELGKREDATVMLKNLLEKKPEYVQASMLLGDILCSQEMYKEALNVYNKGLKHSPNNYDLYYSMGIVYTMLNDFPNAKLCYEKAATINSLLTHAYYALGQINLIEMDLDEAERYFNKCLEDKEQEPDAYYKLGKIYMLRGDHDNAVHFINLAIELDNNYIRIANQEPIFIPIKSKFKMPIIDEEDIGKRKTSHTEKEKKAMKHLDKTYGIVGKLNIHKLKPKTKSIQIGIEDEREKF